MAKPSRKASPEGITTGEALLVVATMLYIAIMQLFRRSEKNG